MDSEVLGCRVRSPCGTTLPLWIVSGVLFAFSGLCFYLFCRWNARWSGNLRTLGMARSFPRRYPEIVWVPRAGRGRDAPLPDGGITGWGHHRIGALPDGITMEDGGITGCGHHRMAYPDGGITRGKGWGQHWMGASPPDGGITPILLDLGPGWGHHPPSQGRVTLSLGN